MFKTITRFWLCLAILFSTNLYAQEHLLPVLSGKVIDAQSGEAIVGATISVDFKKSGATTDAAGQYKISLPYGEYVLKVSSV